MEKAVFLDRDGTINIDHGYVYEIDQFEFIEGSIEALLELKKMGYLPVFTDQKTSLKKSCVEDNCLSNEFDNIWYG